ncbi:uncharacterized protein YdiU (UPF0061 family) [Alkalihalobacillus xiaoxiensis]|uniref:Protein nucleotidyltransferase YdiU n=1 Tax=Shouchella xiaoxiensis TaxID=766895 RepID=A0ABS2SP42_9BACI|nr:YdiU family protein [Shouchella xiaoxiensis]MBM7837280.1 uncharacterized protein YdiU (UPF0061 family) [Shouchella xiaoxiensis]
MPHQQGESEIGWNIDASYKQLPEAFYSLQRPNLVQSPQLKLFNHPLAETLGFDPAVFAENGLSYLAGNQVPYGEKGLAQAYAGHQFGHFTMLGDGRALLLGEQMTKNGERYDIQLKGSGKTSFSRGGDGRAALGPMLREYLISEAMHGLGIPTTRSLAVVTTGENVYRKTTLPGAVLTRVAKSHLRVGTFQYAAAKGNVSELKALADYAINRHPLAHKEYENQYLSFLYEVIERQAKLVASWQLVGFVHGVMNTDNMTISGETIDYGPCAFIDHYDPATVFSSIDQQGRYAYGNQPYMANWNLARFAEALVPLLDPEKEKAVGLAQEAIESFKNLYLRHWFSGMKKKLGLVGVAEGDEALIEELLALMEQEKVDFTNAFRALTFMREDETLFGRNPNFIQWKEKWLSRTRFQAESKEEVQELMKLHNPAIIPRNHLVEEALEAAVKADDYRPLEKLLEVLADPYAHSTAQEAYTMGPDQHSNGYVTYCGT